MNLWRRWMIGRGYRKLAKQMAKDPQYKALVDRRRRGQSEGAK